MQIYIHFHLYIIEECDKYKGNDRPGHDTYRQFNKCAIYVYYLLVLIHRMGENLCGSWSVSFIRTQMV